jgi:hypothetical protein
MRPSCRRHARRRGRRGRPFGPRQAADCIGQIEGRRHQLALFRNQTTPVQAPIRAFGASDRLH